MAYRNITVAGKTYQYVVGKTHLKVKGVGCWPKEDVGVMQRRAGQYCECCGEPLEALYSSHVVQTAVAVTPARIAHKIAANTQ